MGRAKDLKTIHNRAEIPSFTSEEEEHLFWSTHELSDDLWDQAEPLGPDELPSPRSTTRPVVIQIDEATLKRVKDLARRRHTEYQDLLSELVTSHLAEEEQRTG